MIIFWLIAHVIIASLLGVLLFRTVRWIQRQSAPVGMVVASGLLARLGLGLALFWISYLDLPVLRSLHGGDGFWVLAPDARGYFESGVVAVTHGLWTVNRGASSPFFVQTLAAWMKLVGISPAAGLYLNVFLYVGIVACLVRLYRPRNEWRADGPLVIAAMALSWSPVSVIHGTQPLKDDLFTMLIAAICIGVLLAGRALAYSTDRPLVGRDGFVVGVAILAGAAYSIAGMRAYYAVIIWTSFALTLTGFAIRQRGALSRYVSGGVTALVMVWIAYSAGAGPHYRGPKLALLTGRAPSAPAAAKARAEGPVHVIEQARAAFVTSGGATSIAVGGDCDGCGRSVTRHIRAVAVGLASVFIPISILKASSIVVFSGGRALLPIADLDTVIMDLGLWAVLTHLYRQRQQVRERAPLVVFALTLSAVTAVLLGYVVTNFGSLFRLRMMVAAPVWMLVMALGPARSAHRSVVLINSAADGRTN